MSEKRAKILVVEDDAANAAVFRECLRLEGYDVAVANDGRTAIALLRHTAFDVVLTDMLMPDIDGLQLMEWIRKQPTKPAVIAMSGGGTYLSAAQMLDWAKKMGARAPLLKPFTREQLLAAVAEAVQSRRE